MSFHDELIGSAIRAGNTSHQFRAAAQRQANAFWFWAVVAVAVSYLSSWMWGLIPGVFAIFTAAQSISSTITARGLEEAGL